MVALAFLGGSLVDMRESQLCHTSGKHKYKLADSHTTE